MTKIKELQAGFRSKEVYLIKDVKNGVTAKGAPYLSITVQDNSGTIEGKFWDVKPNDIEICQSGRFILFSFEVLLYKETLQLKIAAVSEADTSALDMNEYVIASQVSEKERRESAEEMIHSIQNETYRSLVEGMLAYVGDKFYSYPAASKIHHNFLGGLSEHSESMALMAEDICKHYPQLDRDLLISACLIHDVGKTSEMSGPVTTEYTLEGKLEGHISLANGWLTEVAEKKGLENTEEAILLHHMILSHHGHYEFGSPVLPMLQEAEILTLIDNMDARLNTLKQALDSTKKGNWTAKLFALENRQFYKPKSYKG